VEAADEIDEASRGVIVAHRLEDVLLGSDEFVSFGEDLHAGPSVAISRNQPQSAAISRNQPVIKIRNQPSSPHEGFVSFGARAPPRLPPR
jgi:hypothetical protein